MPPMSFADPCGPWLSRVAIIIAEPLTTPGAINSRPAPPCRWTGLGRGRCRRARFSRCGRRRGFLGRGGRDSWGHRRGLGSQHGGDRFRFADQLAHRFSVNAGHPRDLAHALPAITHRPQRQAAVADEAAPPLRGLLAAAPAGARPATHPPRRRVRARRRTSPSPRHWPGYVRELLGLPPRPPSRAARRACLLIAVFPMHHTLKPPKPSRRTRTQKSHHRPTPQARTRPLTTPAHRPLRQP